ncbi:MAG: DUF483 domain-containing protein [Candidatus Portnoybacteria bacterium]|nr:DUF483 domain-containing protein [Candidatus Portnoybacteria bacterium]MDD4983109.1 DUF483 domain-containing protein [Candidatus Portnoybacteria bacterium]
MNERDKELIQRLHDNFNVCIQDAIALIHNLKPSLRISMGTDKSRELNEILAQFNLKAAEPKTPSDSADKIFFIAKDDAILNELRSFKPNLENPGRIGELLGYPSCCVNSWIRTQKRETEESFPRVSKCASNDIDRMDHQLNFLLHTGSRLKIGTRTKKRFDEFLKQPFHPSRLSYLIPHIPCSFSCRHSKKYARALKHLLERPFPEYLKQMEYFLKKPVLLINDFEFLLFNGKITNNGRLSYDTVIDVNNLFKKGLIGKIAKGDGIAVSPGYFEIYDNGRRVGKINTKAEFFNFV